jgi:hypothetical protein
MPSPPIAKKRVRDYKSLALFSSVKERILPNMKLPDECKQRFERRVSTQVAALHRENEKKRDQTGFSSSGNYHQRFITKFNDLIDFTKRLFDIEVKTLIEIYQECGTRPDDQDYDDQKNRLDSIAQAHINNFHQSHNNNVFAKNNVPNLELMLESIDRKIKANVYIALEPFQNFIEDEKDKAREEDLRRKTGF